MAQHSAIEWTDHTFNPWWGCTKVSPGCKYCYAEAIANRFGHDVWGDNNSRRLFGKKHWEQPLKWNKKAEKNKKRARVFCASMADVFEKKPELINPRNKLWDLIEKTPMLDWLLLTKRPENMTELVPWHQQWPNNVWAMVTVENQKYAVNRIPLLMEIPARIKGLSLEPMIGPVDLGKWLRGVQWVIVGGESGYESRPMNPDWIRVVRDQCLEYEVAFFFKQWGNWIPSSNENQGKKLRVKSSTGESETIYMKRVRKKNAGYKIDGKEWKQVPV
jgi:protein gp37